MENNPFFVLLLNFELQRLALLTLTDIEEGNNFWIAKIQMKGRMYNKPRKAESLMRRNLIYSE